MCPITGSLVAVVRPTTGNREWGVDGGRAAACARAVSGNLRSGIFMARGKENKRVPVPPGSPLRPVITGGYDRGILCGERRPVFRGNRRLRSAHGRDWATQAGR